MRILNDSHVVNIHVKGVTQPSKLLTDVVEALACFVQKVTCPNLERVSGVLAQVLAIYPGRYYFDRLSNKRSHSISHHVHQECFLCVVTPKRHAVELLQSPCSEDHPLCMYDWAKIRVGAVRQKSNSLAILVILLDAPCDPDRICNVQG